MTWVVALYWLDRRGGVDTWFGGPGSYGRPDNAIDIVTSERPTKRGDLVEGLQVGHDAAPAAWRDCYSAAEGMVLVIGIPVPPSNPLSGG